MHDLKLCECQWETYSSKNEMKIFRLFNIFPFPLFIVLLPFNVFTCKSVNFSHYIHSLLSFLPLLIVVVVFIIIAFIHRGKLTGAWFCSIFELLVSFSFQSLAATISAYIGVFIFSLATKTFFSPLLPYAFYYTCEYCCWSIIFYIHIFYYYWINDLSSCVSELLWREYDYISIA